jgi:hypothetical protein
MDCVLSKPSARTHFRVFMLQIQYISLKSTFLKTKFIMRLWTWQYLLKKNPDNRSCPTYSVHVLRIWELKSNFVTCSCDGNLYLTCTHFVYQSMLMRFKSLIVEVDIIKSIINHEHQEHNKKIKVVIIAPSLHFKVWFFLHFKSIFLKIIIFILFFTSN